MAGRLDTYVSYPLGHDCHEAEEGGIETNKDKLRLPIR